MKEDMGMMKNTKGGNYKCRAAKEAMSGAKEKIAPFKEEGTGGEEETKAKEMGMEAFYHAIQEIEIEAP